MPKIEGNDIRPGHVIEHKGGLWQAQKIQHTQPGKGGAYMQVELKNMVDGTKLNERFRASQTVERVRLEQRPFQFLYGDDDMLTFMDTETFDQVSVNKSLLGDKSVFLQEGMEVVIEFHEDTPLNVTLPDEVTLEIADTEPVVKGQTATASYKSAVLENGVKTSVPPFISMGDKVVVSSTDGSYLKRAE